MVTSLLMLSMLLCDCGWLMLPPCHLIVCLLPPCHLIVCLLFLNYSMVCCCFFDCIGQNEVMQLTKKGNDAMISMLHISMTIMRYGMLGIPLERSNYALSNDVLKNNHIFNICNRPEYRYGILYHQSHISVYYFSMCTVCGHYHVYY